MTGSIASIDGLHAMHASSKCRVCCREKPVNERDHREPARFLEDECMIVRQNSGTTVKTQA
jgi:hypothetical protein